MNQYDECDFMSDMTEEEISEYMKAIELGVNIEDNLLNEEDEI